MARVQWSQAKDVTAKAVLGSGAALRNDHEGKDHTDAVRVLRAILPPLANWDPEEASVEQLGDHQYWGYHLVWLCYEFTWPWHDDEQTAGWGRVLALCVRLAVSLGIPPAEIAQGLASVPDEDLSPFRDAYQAKASDGRAIRTALVDVAEGTARSRRVRSAARSEFAELLAKRLQVVSRPQTSTIVAAVRTYETSAYEAASAQHAQKLATERAKAAAAQQSAAVQAGVQRAADARTAQAQSAQLQQDGRFANEYQRRFGSAGAREASERARAIPVVGSSPEARQLRELHERYASIIQQHPDWATGVPTSVIHGGYQIQYGR